ncbi:MAG: signal peptidase I [Ruminococcus sp.]|nr:signal peptidase I [Ruminococcus sp.]
MANEINYQEMDNSEADVIKEKGLGVELYEWLESLGTMTMLVLLIVIFLFRLSYVEGDSMSPTLENGDALFVTDFDYVPQAGDIVIVDSDGLGKFIVKRVIATAGQTIDIDFEFGTVSVDGQYLEEPYANGRTFLDEGGFEYPVTVPENSIFVMGDNRMHSTDSRDARIGFVDQDSVYGKVVIRVYPFNKITTY